jgi:hypothetical protein
VSTQLQLEAELTPRGGLGAVGPRLLNEPLTIAYHGASVTAQKSGYRPLLHESLRRRFGQEHRLVTAAVGGVGPASSVFLLDWLAIRHDPDLCLVELSTHDEDGEIEKIEAAAEGIVAKLESSGCRACFLHLYRGTWDEEHRARVVGIWERVADRHRIPSIDVGPALRDAIDSGAVRKEELLRDGMHTTPAGSELVAAMLDGALGRLAEARITEEALPALRPPGEGSEYSRARLLDAAPEHAQGRGSLGLFRLQLPYLQVGVGDPIELIPPAPLMGIAAIVGPESGEIRVASEAGERRKMLFDRFCHYERLNAVRFGRHPPGEPVRIELTDAPVDYSVCRRPLEPPARKSLKLVGYMVLGERHA